MDKMDTYDSSWKAIFKPQKGEKFFQGVEHQLNNAHQHLDYGNAWFLSECMRLTYIKDSELQQRHASEQGLSVCATADCDDVFAVLWHHKKSEQYILCFRGTSEIKNWLANIDLAPCQWPYQGLVHSGFFESFCRCWEILRNALHYNQHALICCGHSLGGAMAHIAAIYTQANALYTIGCPRIGNQDFSNLFTNISCWRMCNSLDIITHLPPEHKRSPFKHVAEAVWLGAKQRKRDRFKERFAHIQKWFQSPEHIADHAPINYSTRLAELYHNSTQS
ncbi:MAG: lipase family protein [Planctomycetes bacterium]|nr:lipase family protein [Planctomycetota bacterium]